MKIAKKKTGRKGKRSKKAVDPIMLYYDFTQEIQANVEFGQDPGQSPILLFQDLNKFTLPLATPSTSGSPGDTFIITGTHAFPTNVGFINFTTYMDGPEVNGKSSGEAGFTIKKNSIKFTVVGDSAVIKEKVENLRNRPLVFLFRDPTPGSTRYQQLGTQENPAVLESEEQTSGNKSKGGTKGYVVTVSSMEQIYDYQGTIVYNS